MMMTCTSTDKQHARQFEFGRERDEAIERHVADGYMVSPGKKNDMRTRRGGVSCVDTPGGRNGRINPDTLTHVVVF